MALAVVATLLPAQASAQVRLPPVNLNANFLDGVGGPGLLVQQFTDVYDARVRVGEAPHPARLSSVTTLTHVAWITRHELVGGHFGVELLAPTASVRIRSEATPGLDEWGVGDLTLSPLVLQWRGRRVLGLRVSHRLSLPVTLPTGGHDRSARLNIGSGHWRFDPYWAVTLEPSDRFELSARLMYLWNGARPSAPGHPSQRPGQAFHATYASSYEVRRGVRIGLAGYLLSQRTPHAIDGVDVPGSLERVTGLGPGVRLSWGRTRLTANVYFESGARQRPRGTRLSLRIAHVFPTRTGSE